MGRKLLALMALCIALGGCFNLVDNGQYAASCRKHYELGLLMSVDC